MNCLKMWAYIKKHSSDRTGFEKKMTNRSDSKTI
jgi:hypothetical protein